MPGATLRSSACRRDDHHGTSQREQPDGARARTDDLVIRAHVLPRHVHALRIHTDMRASDVGGDIVGKALGRVIAAPTTKTVRGSRVNSDATTKGRTDATTPSDASSPASSLPSTGWRVSAEKKFVVVGL